MNKRLELNKIKCYPLTPERWDDLVALFGPRGGYGGCWCMYWRLKRSEWSQQCGEENKKSLKALIESGYVPGILAYLDKQPVGWCSIAPREEFGALERSRKLKRIDNKPVWSIVCFFVAKPFRGQGITTTLLRSAIEYVRSKNGKIIEAYPIWPDHQTNDVAKYMGAGHIFKESGFIEISRIDAKTSIMRYYLDDV